MRHFYRIYFQICPLFARIISTKFYFSSPRYIPKNYLKTKLFNIDADRIDAPKWHSKPQSKITLKCKSSLKFRQKKFNILNSEYSKFLIYNNPSFAITKSAGVSLDIAFVKINSAIFLFYDHHFAKTNSCNS